VTVPAGADVVISIEDTSGLRALFAKAGTHSPSLSAESMGASLQDRVGVDLLSDAPASSGLSRKGARLLVFTRGAVGLSAPVRNAAAAKKMLASWVAERPGRRGRVVGSRLLTASGQSAAALVPAMSRQNALSGELAARAKGPVWMWARLADPLRAMVLSLDASGDGLVGRGTVTAAAPLLIGRAPAGCDGTVACVRAGLAPAGRLALAGVLERLGLVPQPELSGAVRVEERIESVQPGALAGPGSLPRALPLKGMFERPEADGPALQGRIDLSAIGAALAELTPLDALRGPMAAGTYAFHVVYGRLLRNAGPLTFTGDPRENAADVEVRLPIR
jgi:hypothetical protein